MNLPSVVHGNEKYYHFVSIYVGSMGNGMVEADGKQTSINDFLQRHGGGRLIHIEDEKHGGLITALFETNDP